MVKARSQFKERRYGTCICCKNYAWLCFYLFDQYFMAVKFITNLILDFSTATNVEIELPVPPDATNPNVRTSMGSAAYAPETDSLVWKIKSFPGGKVGIFWAN